MDKKAQIQELISRLRALVRRASGHTKSILDLGPLQLDLRTSNFFEKDQYR